MTHIENSRLRSMINQRRRTRQDKIIVCELWCKSNTKLSLKNPLFLKQLCCAYSLYIKLYSFANFVTKKTNQDCGILCLHIYTHWLIYIVLCRTADKNSTEPVGLCGTLRENKQPDASQQNSTSPAELSFSSVLPSHSGNNKFLLLCLSIGK